MGRIPISLLIIQDDPRCRCVIYAQNFTIDHIVKPKEIGLNKGGLLSSTGSKKQHKGRRRHKLPMRVSVREVGRRHIQEEVDGE